MGSIKVLLRAKKLKDGTHPIVIQIIKNRVASIIHLGYSLKKEAWDAKNQRVKNSHPNSARLNNLIATKRAEATNTALDLDVKKEKVTSRAVRERIKPSGGFSFFTQAENYLKELQATGKYNQYTANKPRIGHFKKFLKGADVFFADVTPQLLNRFTHELRTNPTIRETRKLKNGEIVPPKEKINERTVMNHLASIRSVFAHAAKNGVVAKSDTPFGTDKISIKFPESTKIGLNAEDVALLEQVELEDASCHHARNLWLFSFYLAGMRISDVLRLKWPDIQNGRLFYTMGKNDKAGSLKMPEQAMAIIKQYAKNEKKGSGFGFIFPELKKLDAEKLKDTFNVQREIAFATSRIDKVLDEEVKVLAGIDPGKKLTMHIARHTFASLAGDKVPIQMIQKLYRHSSITTTINYQANFIHKAADDALEAVLSIPSVQKAKRNKAAEPK